MLILLYKSLLTKNIPILEQIAHMHLSSAVMLHHMH